MTEVICICIAAGQRTMIVVCIGVYTRETLMRLEVIVMIQYANVDVA